MRLLTLTLLLPLMAVSTEVYANHNYQHHPNQAYVMEGRSAFAPAVQGAMADQQQYRHHGGPKSAFIPSR
jgi:hypothetical protein